MSVRRGTTSLVTVPARLLKSTSVAIICLVMVGVAGWGCRSSERAMRSGGRVVTRGGEQARALLGTVDPTGVVAETASRQRFWEKLQAKVEAFDVDALNETVRRIGAIGEPVEKKIDQIDVEEWQALRAEISALVDAIRKQVEAVELRQASASVSKLAETGEHQLASLDVPKVNEALSKVEQSMGEVVADTRQVADETRRILKAVPAEDVSAALKHIATTSQALDRTAADLPATVERLNGTARSATLTLNIATGVLVIFGLAGLAWLVSMLRRGLR
ncbi:MAG: hypothetical protein J5J06_11470 [Phycisphaerae bacterium]|nr:hypothetical protein [Phycisphaerae bacterium]